MGIGADTLLKRNIGRRNGGNPSLASLAGRGPRRARPSTAATTAITTTRDRTRKARNTAARRDQPAQAAARRPAPLHPPRPRPPAAPEARSRPAQDRSAGLPDRQLAGRRKVSWKIWDADLRPWNADDKTKVRDALEKYVRLRSRHGSVLNELRAEMQASSTDVLRGDKNGARRDNGVCDEDVPPRRSHATSGRNRSSKHRAATAPCQSPSPAGPGPSRAAGRARPPARDACLTRGAGLIGQ
jgi:hypothetical protein